MLRAVTAAARVATTVVRPAVVQPFIVEAVTPLRAMCTVTQVSGAGVPAVLPPRPTSAAHVSARGLASPALAPQTFLDRAEVTERVLTVLKGFDKVDGAKLSSESHFKNDLGLDSLDAVEVCMALEEEFCVQIPDAEADKIFSVPDAIEFLATHPQAK